MAGFKALFDGDEPVMQMARIDRDELGTKKRDYRHCHEVRSKQCENNRKSQRCEKIFAYAEEKDNREEDDTGAEGSGQNSELYLFAALDGSFRRRFAHLHVPEDVFQDHNGVVDQAG